MYQICKMVGLVVLLVRCGSLFDWILQSYIKIKMVIFKVFGLGLLFEWLVFEMYNWKVDGYGKLLIDFVEYEEKMQVFKDKYIYQCIFEVEEEENL